ncbi:HepT-like ribonuclease domain-containing protein [Hydrogenimonas sp.]|uniref:HepT-like ribonuclease domain-containing protein n=1 Tax=Hydrogenimonas sp. TaxID=2231112 RepID=UPI0026211B1E|nr:HepT-like ribonuclease domain-containing protein [Hydrogenimonas sp.]
MPDEKVFQRLETILKKISFIENIVREYGSVHHALADEQMGRASILMHLTSISEQFDKLLHSGEFDALSFFEKEDIKGSNDLRNFIAHDYEGVDLYIVEAVLNERLPIIKKSAEKALHTLKK